MVLPDDVSCSYDSHDQEIENLILNFRDQLTHESELDNNIKSAEEKVADLEKTKEGMPSQDSLSQAHSEARKELDELKKQAHEAKRKERDISKKFGELEAESRRCQQKLANLANESKQRKERVFRMYPKLEQIDRWIRDHSGEFRKPVLGPIACVVNPKSPHAAAMLEQHVSNKIWKGFVVLSSTVSCPTSSSTTTDTR